MGYLTRRGAQRRLFILLAAAAMLPAQTTGPAKGSLVIVGGAMRDPAIFGRFLELAGGDDAPIVVMPTAGEGQYDAEWSGQERFRKLGATNLTVLHTRDRRVSNREEFVASIRKAKGVWFPGGRQWRLADAYLDTLVHRELNKLLARGGVIGGSSAGATIQGSYLARGDTKTNTVMMGDHEHGFAFIDNVAIDQHLLRRNRQFDLLEIIRAKPGLLGVGIDEDTAIVVEGNRFEVIGRSFVAIYDSKTQAASGNDFYLLAPGDEFDLVERQARRNGKPLE